VMANPDSTLPARKRKIEIVNSVRDQRHESSQMRSERPPSLSGSP
jgi:hypothetical protein